MKKFVSSLVVLLLVLSCTTALAAYEAPVIFSSVCNYGDTVYTVPEADYSFYSELKGGNIRLSQLPKAITSRSSSVDYGHVTSFCCYNNKIYFTVCVDDNTRRSKIFSCNMDGSNITFLAAYAQPFYS